MDDWIDIRPDPAHVARERARARELRASPWWREQLQRGVCYYCGKKVGAANLTMDHVIPVARGGTSDRGNVVPSCKACNSAKKYLTPAEQILSDLAPAPAQRRLVVASPHGFCSGVSRAIQTAEELLAAHPNKTIYCLHEIVHNAQVVDALRARGMVFVSEIGEIPPGATVLFSAHGVSPAVRAAAAARALTVTDATCPFVARVHETVRRLVADGRHIFYLGHPGHDEAVGVCGEAEGHVELISDRAAAEAVAAPSGPSAVVTQTTMELDEVGALTDLLATRIPGLEARRGADICYATRHRQEAVRALARACPVVLVLGSHNSSNSRRLVEAAEAEGADARLLTSPEELPRLLAGDETCVGLTAGASTPEELLDETIDLLRRAYGFCEPETLSVTEEAK